MISWLLLFVSLFYQSTQDGIGKEKGVLHCGPQNLTLEKSDQMILSTWEDDPSCFALRDVLIYELVVLIEEQEVHRDKLAVSPDQIGSTHSWSWTPYLALECASHSVRISSRYNNRTSPWTQEKTLPGRGASKKPQVFPQDKVFEVGRHGNFCCIMPAGAVFDKMYMSGYNNLNMKTRKINNQTYVLTVLLDQPSKHSCTNVKCQTSDYGACAYIGYRPDDRDLQCETQDLESVDCLWTVGKETYLPKRKFSTEYQLNGSDCPNGSKGRCSQKIQEVGERTWTLTTKNNLGKKELTDRADLMKRVHMFAPKGVSASAVNARNVTLSWSWKVQRYSNLNITCQVNVSHFETNTMSEIFGVGLLSVVVTDLIPNWTYNVAVRCGTTEHFWKWSNWSSSVNFHTRGDVPDALDVWMQARDNQTVIIWKEPQANESHGDILEYEVSWTETAERERLNKTKVDHNSISLTLDPTEEHIVTVSARNINGSSSPTTIVIPRRKSDITNVETDGIIGSDGGFNLSWSVSSAASCGYVVDWCPASESCRVEWLKVPPNVTNTRVFSKSFKAGVRYSLSVYACTNRAPVLLEQREGYTEEKRIEDGLFQSLKWNQRDSDVEISWEPVPLRNQTAFIYGYVLDYVDNNNNNKLLSVSTDDPKASSLTATNLNINTYTFTVRAKTAAGEGGATTITATLNSLTDNLIEIVCVSLVAVFGLLSLVTTLCFRHWSCIKHKVYPPIPTPVLRDKWLTMGENRCHHLRVDQFPHSEADVMDVPELHKPGAPVNDYVIQENLPYVSAHTQTEKSYYNQPVRNCIPQPSSAIHPPFRSLFPNPSYSLTMVPGYQLCSSGPEPQGGTHLEKSSDGYQPQSEAESSSVNQTDERPDSPMSCVSTYILLPQSPQ